MMNRYDSPILPPNVAPLAAKGGKRRKSRRCRTKKHKRSNKTRTRRHH